MGESKTTTEKKRAAAPERPGDGARAAAAFQRIVADAQALDAARLRPIDIDIPIAVSVALGALGSLASLRQAVVDELPKFPIATWDLLEDYALGAWYAHLVTLPQPTGPSAVADLEAEATSLRENLLGDAEALARRGLLDGDAVSHIRSGQGQTDRATDLVALSALLWANWDKVQSKTAASEEEVHRAAELGPALLNALGVKRSGVSAEPEEQADMRARCFTLFVHAYDQCRRAVGYLRWDEDDAGAYAPSLHIGRARQ